jgi:predicted acetyltransferase
MNSLKLIKPSIKYIKSILEFKREFMKSGETLHGGAGLTQFDTVEEWFSYLNLLSNAKSVPKGYVQSTEYITVRSSDDRMVGIVNIRHYLNDYLLKVGGHVGYSIRPTERRKGYAKEQLVLALEKCHQLGINKILITCNKDNEASRKTIIGVGGIKENEIVEEDGNIVERYWVLK